MVDDATASLGGMIALLPADPTVLTVDHPAADPPDDIHVTLAYLGADVSGWDDQTRARVIAAVRDATTPHVTGPITARVMGHATFNPDGGPDGDRDPCAVHLIGDSPDLEPLRERVVAYTAATLGPDMHDQHRPTIWHVTAGYGLTAADLDYTGPVTFDRVLVRLAGADTVIRLDAAIEARRLIGADLVAPQRRLARELATPPVPVPGRGKRPAERSALFATVLGYRRRLHRKVRADLAPAVAAYTASAPAALIGQAITPSDPRTARKASAGLALASTLYASGHADDWLSANAAAQRDAYAAGASGAAHYATDGAVDLAPVGAPDAAGRGAASGGIPNTVSIAATPADALDAQLDALAGDLADLYTGDGDVTDEDIADALDAALGVWLLLDHEAAGWFTDGALGAYAAAGIALVNWTCCPPECQGCRDVESGGPYLVGYAPGPLHPGCMCLVTPT